MQEPTLDTLAAEQQDTQFALVEDRLARDYTDAGASTVHAVVERERSRFAGARIHAFVPVLVERAARAELAAPPARHRRATA